MLEINICIGTACHLNGAQNVIATFRHLVEEYKLHDKVKLNAAFCMRVCTNSGVGVSIGDKKVKITPEEAREYFVKEILPLVK